MPSPKRRKKPRPHAKRRKIAKIKAKRRRVQKRPVPRRVPRGRPASKKRRTAPKRRAKTPKTRRVPPKKSRPKKPRPKPVSPAKLLATFRKQADALGLLEREAPAEGYGSFIEHKRKTQIHQRENVRLGMPLNSVGQAKAIVHMIASTLWRVSKSADEYTASVAYVQFAREKDYYGYHAVPLSFDPKSALHRVMMSFESVPGSFASLKLMMAGLLTHFLQRLGKPLSAVIVEAVNVHAYVSI